MPKIVYEPKVFLEGQLIKNPLTDEYVSFELNEYDFSNWEPVFYKDGRPVMEDDFKMFYGYIKELETEVKKLKTELEALKKQLAEFWKFLPEHYDIETKEELEELAKQWNPPNPLLVTLHHIWKRDPKVEALKKDIETWKNVSNTYKSHNEDFFNVEQKLKREIDTIKKDKERLLKAFRELEKEKTCDKCGELLEGPKKQKGE